MLRLEDGEDLFAALQEFAKREHVRAGVIVSGIGMLKSGAIGYWNGHEYSPSELSVPYELVALHGSIAEEGGSPSLHLHTALAGPDHLARAGHLLRGTVGVLAEVYVETFPNRSFGRPMNESLGLRTLDLQPGPTA
jgi:predicted DNA-binding protein with PD1-like motif